MRGYPALDELDGDHWADIGISPYSGVRGTAYPRRYPRAPVLTTLGGADCWCGQPRGHDWPGKAEGEAHPR